MSFDLFFGPITVAGMVSGLLEGSGIPWPGAVVMAAAGTEVKGLATTAMLATLFSIMYTLSSSAQYLLARYGWQKLERFLSPKLRSNVNRMAGRYGELAVLWTRPLAIGNYISIPAGIMRMNPLRFVLYTFVGIWPWAFGMVAMGGVISQYLTFASSALPLVAGALVVVAILMGLWRLWGRTEREPTFGD